MGRSQGGLARAAVLFGFFLSAPAARALTFTDSFTSTASQNSSQLVWNIGTGELHPPLRVENWDDGNGADMTDFSIGDGRHGAFNVNTYARFGTVTGTTIYLNTDAYPELQFTSFHLAAGYTLRPVGSRPLVIRSMSTVVVEGTIDCSGENGVDGTANALVSHPGGAGRCGGGSGGASVAAGLAPTAANAGQSGGAGVTGGGGGPQATASGGQGGGGGGAFIKASGGGTDKDDPLPGVNPAGGSGGAVGTIHRDDAFVDDIDGAGGGGGGGSAFNDISDPANHGSGGSGGGGGGTIRIYAGGDVTVGVDGAIRADGGNGGSANKGGGGGGGGGGSILIFSGGDIYLNGPPGEFRVTAAAGAGGVSALGGDGGRGAWGRTWLVGVSGFALTPNGGETEDPETQLNIPGDVRYVTGTFTVESNVLDFLNTQPTLNGSFVDTTGTGSATLEVAVSSSADLSAFGSFVDPATLIGQTLDRFFRYRLSVTSGSGTDPLRVQAVSLVYDGRTENEFDFKGACGRVDTATPPFSGASLLFLLPVILLLGIRARVSAASIPQFPPQAPHPVHRH